MKIFGADPNFKQAKVDDVQKREQAASVRNTRNEAAPEAASNSKGVETVALSSFAKEVGKAGTVVRNTPEIRKEKVAAIKEKLANGEYYVSSDKIAGKIMVDIVKHGK